MGDLITPQQRLSIAFGQGSERTARPERIAHIADGAFHTSLLITRAHRAGPRRKVIMTAQLNQPRMKHDVISTPFQHGTLEVVVENHTRLAGPGLKGVHMATQEVLRCLVEEESRYKAREYDSVITK